MTGRAFRRSRNVSIQSGDNTSHEFDYIRWLRDRSRESPHVGVGIGDDTAVLNPTGAVATLSTVDLLMEGVHFTFPPASPEQAGRKALAVNLSDIAAMAGRPLAATVGVALPRHYGIEFAQKLHTGLQSLADEYDVSVVGGDTNIWDGPLVISVAVTGETTGDGPVLRSGARPGDWLFVTGDLGGSLSGHHLSFEPRIVEAQQLHRAVDLHAMIDVSDGLAADLSHLLEESSVGAVIFADQIPLGSAAHSRTDTSTPLERALSDGEDFELLFCTSAEDGRRLLEQAPFKTRLTRIGEVTPVRRSELIASDGTRRPLVNSGWKHQF